jgi:hypothetical protein
MDLCRFSWRLSERSCVLILHSRDDEMRSCLLPYAQMECLDVHSFLVFLPPAASLDALRINYLINDSKRSLMNQSLLSFFVLLKIRYITITIVV